MTKNAKTVGTMKETEQAVATIPGEGTTYWTGFPNTIRITRKQTGGAFTLIEIEVPPGLSGPPHVHHREHQTDHVIEGELVYTVGDETIVAGPGTVVHCPRGIPHTFANETDEPAVVYDWLHPAGFDEFMAAAAPELTDPSSPPELDMDRVLELAPEYGLEFMMPGDD